VGPEQCLAPRRFGSIKLIHAAHAKAGYEAGTSSSDKWYFLYWDSDAGILGDHHLRPFHIFTKFKAWRQQDIYRDHQVCLLVWPWTLCLGPLVLSVKYLSKKNDDDSKSIHDCWFSKYFFIRFLLSFVYIIWKRTAQLRTLENNCVLFCYGFTW
jgi:hypothetical protein